MKPQLLKVPTGHLGSFSVRKDTQPNVNNRWHYHQEVELIAINEGNGMQFIGDNMSQFEAGDVILIGSNLPHYWRFETDEIQTPRKPATYATVIHFLENLWGDRFLNIPETHVIKRVLEKSQQGILIKGKDACQVSQLIERIYQSSGLEKLIALMESLSALSECKHQVLLSSPGFRYCYSDSENQRVHSIYEYTLQNFDSKIPLKEIASVAGLVTNSFCRYFRSRTGKTYSQFLTEVRVGHACKLLIEDKLSIKQISYASGFKNFSCFHKQFKNITRKTPLQYQQEIIIK
jgi:AraC-like DNA-binding protein